MKIALSSYSGAGAWFVLKLLSEGHSVDYFLSDKKYESALLGLIPKVNLVDLDHRRSPDNYKSGLPSYEKYDLSVFDMTGRPRQADHSHQLVPTIGDGSFHCFLEDDREGGIEIMEGAGIKVPPYQSFTDIGEAKAFISETGKRYVFKPSKPDSGEQKCEATYVSKSANDLIEYLERLSVLSKGAPFILQEYIEGTEISIEGWFNGDDFYCINCTFEEKKFMNDRVGPNTGCAGNLVCSLSPQAKLYKQTLEKMKPILQNYGFRGMLDLNTIITESEIYGLEWTPRFGYDATCTFAAMYAGGFGELLYRVANGEIPENSWKAQYGASVRVSIPPYPTEMRMPQHRGIPIKGIDIENEEDILSYFLYDAALEKKKLVVSGLDGFVCCPIQTGETIGDAFDQINDRLKKLRIPDMQYRTDICDCVKERYYKMELRGLL